MRLFQGKERGDSKVDCFMGLNISININESLGFLVWLRFELFVYIHTVNNELKKTKIIYTSHNFFNQEHGCFFHCTLFIEVFSLGISLDASIYFVDREQNSVLDER